VALYGMLPTNTDLAEAERDMTPRRVSAKPEDPRRTPLTITLFIWRMVGLNTICVILYYNNAGFVFRVGFHASNLVEYVGARPGRGASTAAG
jgi:hypothetical protein